MIAYMNVLHYHDSKFVQTITFYWLHLHLRLYTELNLFDLFWEFDNNLAQIILLNYFRSVSSFTDKIDLMFSHI